MLDIIVWFASCHPVWVWYCCQKEGINLSLIITLAENDISIVGCDFDHCHKMRHCNLITILLKTVILYCYGWAHDIGVQCQTDITWWLITSSNKRQLTSRKKIVGSHAMTVENHKQDTVKGGAVH